MKTSKEIKELIYLNNVSRASIKEEYENTIKELNLQLKNIRTWCSHKNTSYQSDPCGGHDSCYECDDCGKAL